MAKRIIAANSIELDPPQIIFAGGGYGSGKTTRISYEAEKGRLPMHRGHMAGVDYFKLYIPEFSLIQEMADGRASLTVQDECKVLATNLFQLLIKNKRSFIWDSSLSNQADSMQKISEAVRNGYKVSLFAVVAPLQVAIRQAMDRAKDTKRFPHPEFLPKSHLDFKTVFTSYVPHFNEIKVFANEGKMGNLPVLIAEKKDGKELAINDEALFNQLLKVPV